MIYTTFPKFATGVDLRRAVNLRETVHVFARAHELLKMRDPTNGTLSVTAENGDDVAVSIHDGAITRTFD